MNNNHLTKRLAAVAAFVPPNARIADIGSDHALLPVHLVATGKIQSAIAGEVIQGPFLRSQAAVTQAGLSEQIQVRLADGLAAIHPADQIDTVVIAGMGGLLICHILAQQPAILKSIEHLILEPNVEEMAVRQWLMQHHFLITGEQILREGGHTYEVIQARRQNKPVVYSTAQLKFGPFLLQAQAPAFVAKWHHRLVTNRRILANLARAQQPPQQKIHALQVENQQIKEVLHG